MKLLTSNGKWPGMYDYIDRCQGRKTTGNSLIIKHNTPVPTYLYDNNMYDEKSPNVFDLRRPVFSEKDDSLPYNKYRYIPSGLSSDRSMKEEISPFSPRSKYPLLLFTWPLHNVI